MELKETMLTRKEIYSGRVFRVTRDEILLPDGSRGIRELVHSYGGVVILPMDEQGNVTLVHQFRYAQDRVLLEAVAGKLEAGLRSDRRRAGRFEKRRRGKRRFVSLLRLVPSDGMRGKRLSLCPKMRRLLPLRRSSCDLRISSGRRNPHKAR